MRIHNILHGVTMVGFAAIAAAAGCGAAPDAGSNPVDQATSSEAVAPGGNARVVARKTSEAVARTAAGNANEVARTAPANAKEVARPGAGKGEPVAPPRGSAPPKDAVPNESNLLLSYVCGCPAWDPNDGPDPCDHDWLAGWQANAPYCSTAMGCGPETNQGHPTNGPATKQSWWRRCVYEDYCWDRTDVNLDGITDKLDPDNCWGEDFTQTWGPSVLWCEC